MAVGNHRKHLGFTLAFSKRFFSLLNLKTYWLLRTRKSKANRYFRARKMSPRNNADATYCEKLCSILKTKRSTDLKTGHQIYV